MGVPLVKKIAAVGLAVFLFSCSLSALAATEAALSYSKGIVAFSDGNFEAALSHFKKAYKADPANTDHIYLLGMTYFRLNDFEKAAKYLKELLEKNPKFTQAYFDYGLALFRMGRTKEALVWFEQAHLKDMTNPNPILYVGLCHYYIGDNQKALDVLKKVAANFAKVEPGKAAAEWVAKIESGGKPSEAEAARKPRRLNMRASASGFYDSNVTLDPDTEILAGYNNNQDGVMTSGSLDAQYLLNRLGEKTKFFAMYSGYQNGYSNVHRGVQLQGFNSGRHKFGIEFHRKISDNFQWRSPITYHFQTLGASKYLHGGEWSGTLNFGWLKNWVTGWTTTFRRDEYFSTPTNPAQSRDSMKVAGRLEQYFFARPDRKRFYKIGYEIEKGFAEGSDWDYLGHSVLFGFSTPLIKKWTFSVFGNVAIAKNFDNQDSVYRVVVAGINFPAQRRDFVYSSSAVLVRPLGKHVSGSFVYSATVSDSSIERYTYKRHIAGASLSWTR